MHRCRKLWWGSLPVVSKGPSRTGWTGDTRTRGGAQPGKLGTTEGSHIYGIVIKEIKEILVLTRSSHTQRSRLKIVHMNGIRAEIRPQRLSQWIELPRWCMVGRQRLVLHQSSHQLDRHAIFSQESVMKIYIGHLTRLDHFSAQ